MFYLSFQHMEHKNEHVPHYYINLYWTDLDIVRACQIHTGEALANPPTHLKFRNIRYPSGGNIDINSNELDNELNEAYIEKFETEILRKIDVKWVRDPCL